MQNFKSIIEFSRYFKDEKVCVDYLKEVRWYNGVTCPHCKHDGKIYHYKTRDIYKCSRCNKQFSVTVGTIFEKSQIPLQKWLMAIYLHITIEKGLSSINLSKQIGVTQPTAWFMLHRIRYAIENKTFDKPLQGVFEMDETFVGGKNKNRHADKKVKGNQGRSFKDKTAITGIYNNETTEVKSVVTISTSQEAIQPIIFTHIEQGSYITTDEWMGYNGIEDYYNRSIVNHKKKQYLSDEGLTTNHIENYWSRVKRTIMGTYHYTSRKHLQNYCNEFDFKHNNRLLTNQDKFKAVMNSTYDKRLLYSTLIKK